MTFFLLKTNHSVEVNMSARIFMVGLLLIGTIMLLSFVNKTKYEFGLENIIADKYSKYCKIKPLAKQRKESYGTYEVNHSPSRLEMKDNWFSI